MMKRSTFHQREARGKRPDPTTRSRPEMTNSEDRIDDIFEEMVETGLLSTSGRWIERAVVQKNRKLTIELAHSTVLVYDILDKLSLTDFNSN